MLFGSLELIISCILASVLTEKAYSAVPILAKVFPKLYLKPKVELKPFGIDLIGFSLERSVRREKRSWLPATGPPRDAIVS